MKNLSLIFLFLLAAISISAQDFEGSFVMKVNSAPESEADENYSSSIKFSIDGAKIAMEPLEMDGQNAQFSRMIFDNNQDKLIMLMSQGGQKMGVVMNKPTFIDTKDKAKEEEEEDIKVTRTGETKEIDGYTCEQVIVESEESITTLWVTDEADFDFAQIMSMAMYKGANPTSRQAPDKDNPYTNMEVGGIPIDIYVQDKASGETQKMMIRDITDKVDESIFSTAGYQMIDMQNIGK